MSGTETERLVARYAPQYVGDPWFLKQVADWVEVDFLLWRVRCEIYRKLRSAV